MLGSGRAGLTLAELLISLVLLGVVAASIHRLLFSTQRLSQHQVELAQLNAELRMAAALLPTELQDLDAAGAAGSDIVAMSDTSITYRGMRGLHVLCRNPTLTGAASGTLVLATRPQFGARRLDARRHAVLVFAEADPSTETDNRWLRAELVAGVTPGSACPGGAASLTVSIRNVVPRGALRGVQTGAPLRSFELTELKGYRDRRGDWWVGVRRRARGGWGAIQPVLGPLAPRGLRLSYWSSAGVGATTPSEVALIGITVIGRTSHRTRSPTDAPRYGLDTLMAQIALRNNRRSRRLRRSCAPPPARRPRFPGAGTGGLGTGWGERGIALALALFALVVIGGLVILTTLFGRQEQRLGRNAIKRQQAVAAAQEGVVAQVAQWHASQYNRVAAGSSAAFSGGLGDRTGWYRGSVRRLNDLLFLVQAEGFSADSRAGHPVGLLVRLRPQRLALESALRTVGTTVLRGSASIRDEDTPPVGWSCAAARSTPAGPRVPTARLLGEIDLDELRSRADAVIRSGTWAIRPRSSDKSCATGDPANWGDPGRPGGACEWYFPIIHAIGAVTLRGGRGQGILIVDGDLALRDGVRFYGPVLVSGRLTSAGLGGHIVGGVIAGAADLEQSAAPGGATITFSSCALFKALAGSAPAFPLGERAWIKLP